MTATYVNIRLENACVKNSRVLELRAVVDPAALHLCIPPSISQTLGLGGECFRYVKQPEGVLQKCRYVGPVTVLCGSHQGYVGAVESGDEVVLGSIPLSALGLAFDPSTSRLIPVPARTGAAYTR